MAVAKKIKNKNTVVNTKKPTIKKMTTPMSDEYRYQAEDDMRTLMRAEEIKADKSRMSKAQKMAKQKVNQMKKVMK